MLGGSNSSSWCVTVGSNPSETSFMSAVTEQSSPKRSLTGIKGPEDQEKHREKIKLKMHSKTKTREDKLEKVTKK